jgi:hypothetical protein
MSENDPSGTEPRAITRVSERLAALRAADTHFARALDGANAALSGIPPAAIDAEPAQEIEAAAAKLRAPLPTELGQLRADAPGIEGENAGLPGAAVGAVQAVYVHAGAAHAAAAALFTTGRLMYLGAACDLAADRMKTYSSLTTALNALLPQVMAWELREEELTCRCVCPMCGLGACGCIWASLHNIDVATGGAGLLAPADRGIPLRSPPRPGSELAAADVQQWDRIVSVDDEPVRTAVELQAALRRHAIGEEVRLGIARHGQQRDVLVRHASDLP